MQDPAPLDIPAAEEAAYQQLQCYTLGRGDVEFIHQHVVDAWAAQHAHAGSKPIGVAFALIGLYLHVERDFTGRQVQDTHMTLARRRREWPVFALPRERRSMSAIDVIAAPAGDERDAAIDAWCGVVWAQYADSREAVAALLQES